MRGGGQISHSFPQVNLFDDIISPENLFVAWKEFSKDKLSKKDVLEFHYNLEDNIFRLHGRLNNETWRHSEYHSFYVHDPKKRFIHKASVADRLLHHAIVRKIEPYFEKTFIFDSWSCRKGKGTHRAADRFQKFAWTLSRNNTKVVWVLKLDIQKFFDSIDQEVLLNLLTQKIADNQVIVLLEKILKSFSSYEKGRGLPLGNITSQLFANVYLHPLDWFVKDSLHIKHYLRYCDDFVLLHNNKAFLEQCFMQIETFLSEVLKLHIHPNKIILSPYHSGVDFLGYICFPHFRILRTTSKRRMLKKIDEKNMASYQGLLKHARTYGIQKEILERF